MIPVGRGQRELVIGAPLSKLALQNYRCIDAYLNRKNFTTLGNIYCIFMLAIAAESIYRGKYCSNFRRYEL